MSSRRAVRRLLLVTAIAVVCGGTLVMWKRFETSKSDEFLDAVPSADATESDDVNNVTFARFSLDSPRYVGIDVCAECHDERVREFSDTNHFRTSRLPDRDELARLLDGGTAIYRTRNPNLVFEMSLDGDTLRQTAALKINRRKAEHSDTADLVYGAGTVDEIYLSWNGNELFQLPMAYLHPLESWGNPPGYIDGTANFSRPIPPRCLECHCTWFDHRPGTVNEYHRENFLLGVTCERCHGPGREHAEYHRLHPDEVSGREIANPADLSRESQIAVCGQCHGNAIKPKTAPFEYVPGEPLEEYFRADLKHLPEKSHTANHVRSMRESVCFQESGSMTCITCHNPHVPEGPQNSASIERSCLICHERESCGKRSSLPADLRDRCIECHMPRHRVDNISFDLPNDEYAPLIERHEHRVAVHKDAARRQLLEWHRSQTGNSHAKMAESLTRELVASYLERGERLWDEYRFLAAAGAFREAARLDPTPENLRKRDEALEKTRAYHLKVQSAKRQIAEGQKASARNLLRQVLEINPCDAEAHGKLGLLLAETGQREEAEAHLKRVHECDPDDAYGLTMLGWLAFLDGDFERSAEFYRQARDIEPYQVKIEYQLGFALFALERFEAAETHLRLAIEIDPDHSGAYEKLCRVLTSLGIYDEAIEAGKRAVLLTAERDDGAWEALAEAHAAKGDTARALEAIHRAIDAVTPGQQERLSELGKRRDEWRTATH